MSDSSSDDTDSQAELSSDAEVVMSDSDDGPRPTGGEDGEEEVVVEEVYEDGELLDAKMLKRQERAAQREARKSAFEQHLDDVSSDDEAIGEHNTIGNVPLEWYHGHDHIGYNIDGDKIARKPQLSGVDALIAARDDPAYKWTVLDNKTGEEYTLTKRELDLIRRIQQGRSAHPEHEAFPEYVDYYTSKKMYTSMRAQDPPKSNFVPDKYEERKIRKLRKLIAAGKITFEKKKKDEGPYLMWGEDGEVTIASRKRRKAPAHIAAPKMALPGHEVSYNPPAEYLAKNKQDEEAEDVDADSDAEEEDELPKEHRKLRLAVRKYDSLRLVPAYRNIVKDRFERCLDLYLCPRVRKSRINVASDALVPQLPDTSELRPFPNRLSQGFVGHTAMIRSLDVSPDGQWLVSGGDDKTVRVWEIANGRCVRTFHVGSKVYCVRWNPAGGIDARNVIAAAVGNELLLICPRAPEKAPEGHILLTASRTRVARVASAASLAGNKRVVTWSVDESPGTAGADEAEAEEGEGEGGDVSSSESDEEGALPLAAAALQRGGEGIRARILHKSSVQFVAWHAKGDYVASVCPNAQGSAVTVHQITRRASHGMFRKVKGQVQRVLFHPTKPIFFVSTKTDVRVFHLVRKTLLKRLLSNVQWMSSLAVHPGGNHLVCGSFDGRLSWWDLDLATTPFKALHFHKKATRAVRFHKRYPLLASSSDDGTVHVFHAKVFNDLLTNPLIVPVKILRQRAEVAAPAPVHDCVFHPTQPWLFSCSDEKIALFTNVD